MSWISTKLRTEPTVTVARKFLDVAFNLVSADDTWTILADNRGGALGGPHLILLTPSGTYLAMLAVESLSDRACSIRMACLRGFTPGVNITSQPGYSVGNYDVVAFRGSSEFSVILKIDNFGIYATFNSKTSEHFCAGGSFMPYGPPDDAPEPIYVVGNGSGAPVAGRSMQYTSTPPSVQSYLTAPVGMTPDWLPDDEGGSPQFIPMSLKNGNTNNTATLRHIGIAPNLFVGVMWDSANDSGIVQVGSNVDTVCMDAGDAIAAIKLAGGRAFSASRFTSGLTTQSHVFLEV